MIDRIRQWFSPTSTLTSAELAALENRLAGSLAERVTLAAEKRRVELAKESAERDRKSAAKLRSALIDIGIYAEPTSGTIVIDGILFALERYSVDRPMLTARRVCWRCSSDDPSMLSHRAIAVCHLADLAPLTAPWRCRACQGK